MFANELLETKETMRDGIMARTILEKFDRSKILEVYFSRLEGRIPDDIPSSHSELYNIELSTIKGFLLGQHPQDTLLQKVFRIMN